MGIVVQETRNQNQLYCSSLYPATPDPRYDCSKINRTVKYTAEEAAEKQSERADYIMGPQNTRQIYNGTPISLTMVGHVTDNLFTTPLEAYTSPIVTCSRLLKR